MHHKTDVPGLVKDPTTKAVLNTDKSALEAYKKKRANADRINRLEEELADIKKLLVELLENRR